MYVSGTSQSGCNITEYQYSSYVSWVVTMTTFSYTPYLPVPRKYCSTWQTTSNKLFAEMFDVCGTRRWLCTGTYYSHFLSESCLFTSYLGICALVKVLSTGNSISAIIWWQVLHLLLILVNFNLLIHQCIWAGFFVARVHTGPKALIEADILWFFSSSVKWSVPIPVICNL